MRFLIDDSSDARLEPYLRSLGHNVKLVARDYGPRIADTDILALAVAEDRVLITNDRDFGELVVRQRREHAGVVFLRLSNMALTAQQARIDAVLERYGGNLRRLLVVTDHHIRVWPPGDAIAQTNNG